MVRAVPQGEVVLPRLELLDLLLSRETHPARVLLRLALCGTQAQCWCCVRVQILKDRSLRFQNRRSSLVSSRGPSSSLWLCVERQGIACVHGLGTGVICNAKAHKPVITCVLIATQNMSRCQSALSLTTERAKFWNGLCGLRLLIGWADHSARFLLVIQMTPNAASQYRLHTYKEIKQFSQWERLYKQRIPEACFILNTRRAFCFINKYFMD